MVKALYEFDVEKQPMFLATGEQVQGREAVVRTDTHETLGVVSKNYKIVPHTKIIDTFNLTGLLTQRKVDVCKGGAVMLASFDFQKNNLADIKVGDTVSFGIRAFNSYDLSLGVGFEIVANRLICTNGLVMPKAMARLSYKHFESFSIDRLTDTLIKRYEGSRDVVQTWSRWTGIKPRADRIKEFYESLPLVTKKQQATLIEKSEDAKDLGVWGVFNVLTYWLTHEMKTKSKDNEGLNRFNKEHRYVGMFYKYNWEK